MGLLLPTAGKILVDDIDIHDHDYPEQLSAWRSTIAHVPQTIFLADSSIAENIALAPSIRSTWQGCGGGRAGPDCWLH